jgi:SAM-dependent methyltransferase
VSVIDRLKARLGRRILLNVRPLRDRRQDHRGRCSVCGRDTVFVFNSWVVPNDQHATMGDPATSAAYTRRESLFCRSCCSSLRVRGIANVLLSLYGPGADSVAQLVRQESFRRLEVAEINTIGSMGSLHSFLVQSARLAFSEYRGADRLGEVIGGARNEDICRLTYADESFDLVLSSDTLEHVPDFRAALRETRRVLRPGGRHVFTVPIVASRATTETRATIGGDGEIVHLLPPLYHGRGAALYRYIPVGEDLLAFTEFGRDLTDYMREAGFEPEVLLGGDDPDETGAAMVFAGRVPG